MLVIVHKIIIAVTLTSSVRQNRDACRHIRDKSIFRTWR